MFYYEVAPTKIVRSGIATFTYHSSMQLHPGHIVTIPVGKQRLTGVVIRSASQPIYETREIVAQVYETPIPHQLIKTALWMATYYASPLATVLQTVLPLGITKQRRQQKSSSHKMIRDRTHFLLSKDQSSALESIRKSTPGTILLHGITGSGKTAIYLAYAKEQVANGRSCIIVVPEIALTSQLVAEFSADFPDLILTHSRQTEAERHITWERALQSPTPQIVIGPRSALFLPLPSIGGIIIDEAHEPSLKQDQSPRYSALRVASMLSKYHGARTIQGSATPLVSEYYLAEATKRPIITLSKKARIDASPPAIDLIDMTSRTNFVHHRFLSDSLLDHITQTLARNEQTLVFHNRRGSASTTLCKSCGWSALCSRCIVPYSLHSDAHELRCHICNSSARVPTSCPICHSTEIIHKGIGTKLIESELQRRFPKARIARFDADTGTKDTVDQRYQELYDGSVDIIIGTQVIAKGLDLPRLRTVGIVQADAGLSLPDFMSSERTFQLLAQTIGRVGRSHHRANVIVQTYQPTAPAIQYGITQDYQAFYKHTLDERQRGKFPPYAYLLKLTCVYKTEAAAIRNSKALAITLRRQHPDLTIFGPTPAFYERQHETYRWQIIVKSSVRTRLQTIIDSLPASHWQYDIDPMNLL